MCGIAGAYAFQKGELREEDIIRMRDSIAYRGPDGAGIYMSPDKRVGLGHRRLAIIDLSPKGAQPMTNSDRSIWVTFNGEIYNFKEVRRDLERKGYRFSSQSDTEVIIHGYDAYGPDIVKRCNGMFAFVIWDEKKKRLFAARDHIGIKPLYYAIQNGVFYFGSEIKAILAHPSFKKTINEQNISYYLSFACMPAPLTLFTDIHKLESGYHLTLENGGIPRIEEYWNPLEQKKEIYDEQTYIQKIRSILEDSIQKQMLSDVPFGCFLSGGIDSSVNAALMSKALGKPVETFSIGTKAFDRYNEFQYSRRTAELLGAHTHERLVDHEDLVRFLPLYAKHADDPNGDQICFLVYYLSEIVRKSGVIVAQVGEGSDEIFAGYDAYQRAVQLHEKIWKHIESLPRPIRAIPSALLNIIPSDRLDFPREYARRLAKGEEPFWGNAIAFSDDQKSSLLTKEYRASLAQQHIYELIQHRYAQAKARDPKADFLEQMTYLELKIRLPELLLMRVDKMAMAHSIEPRVPFLDTRLVELAMHIPQSLKLKNGETKYILKKAVEGIIPNDIIYRKKQGFGAPVREWLKSKTSARPFLDRIFTSRLRERNILDYGAVERLIGAHMRGADDHNFRIWNLVTLSVWYDEWA